MRQIRIQHAQKVKTPKQESSGVQFFVIFFYNH